MSFHCRHSSDGRAYEIAIGNEVILTTRHEKLATRLTGLFVITATLSRMDIHERYERLHLFVDFLYTVHDLSTALLRFQKPLKRGRRLQDFKGHV